MSDATTRTGEDLARLEVAEELEIAGVQVRQEVRIRATGVEKDAIFEDVDAVDDEVDAQVRPLRIIDAVTSREARSTTLHVVPRRRPRRRRTNHGRRPPHPSAGDHPRELLHDRGGHPDCDHRDPAAPGRFRLLRHQPVMGPDAAGSG